MYTDVRLRLMDVEVVVTVLTLIWASGRTDSLRFGGGWP